MAERWRLINFARLDGALNMAVDEVLLESQGRPDSPPVLRLYGWSRPTISLGYSQKMDGKELSLRNPSGADVVRRITGGGAIFHDRELTFCVAGRCGEFSFPNGVGECFVHVSRGIMRGLEILGIKAVLRGGGKAERAEKPEFFCFRDRARYDIVVDGKKLVGSAQRRRREAFIQQGSIIVGTGPGLDDGACIERLLKEKVNFEDLCGCVIRGFEEALEIRFNPVKVTSAERKLAEELVIGKYSCPEWTLKGGMSER